jgi:hypothetical protein
VLTQQPKGKLWNKHKQNMETKHTYTQWKDKTWQLVSYRQCNTVYTDTYVCRRGNSRAGGGFFFLRIWGVVGLYSSLLWLSRVRLFVIFWHRYIYVTFDSGRNRSVRISNFEVALPKMNVYRILKGGWCGSAVAVRGENGELKHQYFSSAIQICNI